MLTYAQLVFLLLAFIYGMLKVPSLVNSLFTGRSGESSLPACHRLRRRRLPCLRIRLPPPGYEFGEARARYVEHVRRHAHVRTATCRSPLLALAAGGRRSRRPQRPHAPGASGTSSPSSSASTRSAGPPPSPTRPLAYTPQAPELKYFLTQFVTQHYSRVQATVRENYAAVALLPGRAPGRRHHRGQPRRASHRDVPHERQRRKSRSTSKNVALEDLRQPPYKATIDFDKVLRLATTTSNAGASRSSPTSSSSSRTTSPTRSFPSIRWASRSPTSVRTRPSGRRPPCSPTPCSRDARHARDPVRAAGRLRVPAPYRAFLPRTAPSSGVVRVVFVNLRRLLPGQPALFLKDTGRKLAHVEKQLRSRSIVGTCLTAWRTDMDRGLDRTTIPVSRSGTGGQSPVSAGSVVRDAGVRVAASSAPPTATRPGHHRHGRPAIGSPSRAGHPRPAHLHASRDGEPRARHARHVPGRP